ncbi:MAG: hypothetical protein ACXWD4_16100 [Bacteroidia bacterium]
MKLYPFKLLVLLLPFLLFTTCDKKNYFQCTSRNTTPILDHAMDYFFFKTGSWWVYEEESSGERDSVWVGLDGIKSDESTAAKRDCNCGGGRCTQEAWVSFYSKKHDGNSIYGFRIYSDFEEDGVTDILESGRIYNNASGHRITYRGKEYNKQSPTYGTYEDLESITVKGKTYTDILHHYYTQQDNIPDWQHEAWYARNIYLVKFRLWDGTTWNLVKYNIVK